MVTSLIFKTELL